MTTILGQGLTSRKHEFFVARSAFQCSSCPGPISHSKSFVFSTSVQCLAPWALPSRSKAFSASSVFSPLRRLPIWAFMLASACFRLTAGEVAPGCTAVVNVRGEWEEAAAAAAAAAAWPGCGGDVDGFL